MASNLIYVVYGILVTILRSSAVDVLTCYSCSYNEPPTADYACVNSPSNVTTANTVVCGGNQACVIREVYSKLKQTITSFYRGCEHSSVKSECDDSGQTRACTFSCGDRLCNSLLGGEITAAVTTDTSTTDKSKNNVANSYKLSMTTSTLAFLSLILALL